jgi:eukaryotic-like serine/threonine-protein kinase
MTKLQDARWDEPSEPEISIGTMIQAHAEDFAGNIVGERFGKYLLVGEIAVGGMAELSLAVHKGVEGFVKVVVIKRVLPHFNNNAEFVRMFIDEARLAARIEHPNIVRTYEFGEVNGQYFTAMEYLAGEDLCKALNNLSMSRQLMPLHIAAGIGAQICNGLHFAHQVTDTAGSPLNLVHRDINPANIILTYGGELKIIDFGVAKTKNANVQTLNGVIKGKVAYMPPEQVLGREVDQRADIFSAGVVLWEVLTGRPLFLRGNEAATLYAIMNAPIPQPSKLRPDVPPELDTIVARALARSPGDRYDTAEQMAAELDELQTRLPRYDARVLAGKLEELFGSTRAEAKRSIAQTRALPRNISLVMKLRSEVRAELAERLDAVVGDEPGRATLAVRGSNASNAALSRGSAQTVEPSRSQRGLVLALTVILLAAIAGGLVYTTTSHPERPPVVKQVAMSALQIESTPSGAAVFVGGEPTGLKTPTTLTGITKPQLELHLELAGHAPVIRSITIPEGTTASVRVTLLPMQGRLVISELPTNAGIVVDGQDYDAGEVIPVTAGNHDIRIVLDGKTVTEQSIETAAGDQNWKLVHGKLVRN